MLNPLKLPTKAWSPPNARSEVTNPKLPGFAGSTKPGRLVEVGEVLEVADRRLGVEPAGTETDPGVLLGNCAASGERSGDDRQRRDQAEPPALRLRPRTTTRAIVESPSVRGSPHAADTHA